MQAALRSILAADAGVAAIVAGRIRWNRMAEGDGLPGLRLSLVADPRAYDLDGKLGQQVSRVQVDALASSPEDVQALAEAVEAALAEVRQVTVGAVVLHWVKADVAADFPAEDPGDRQVRFGRRLDYRVRWSRG